MRLREWLHSNTVDDVLRSKTVKSDEFISISGDHTIWDAMWTFGQNDISAISVYCNPNSADERCYCYILTINDILSYVRKFLDADLKLRMVDAEIMKDKCLNMSIMDVIESLGGPEERIKPTFVKRETCLRNLLDIWIERHSYDDSHRVLVGTEKKVEDVLTMTDLIHYCFLHAHALPDIMQAHALSALYPGTKTPSPFSHSSLVEDSETAWQALSKLLDSSPVQVVGIVEASTGNLIGYLSSMDFMPSEDANQIFSILSSLNRSVASFVKLETKGPSRLIDAVTFRDQMTLEQLIERLLKLRVHMLWRIAFTGQVIGVVTAVDVLKYLKRCSDLDN